MRKRQVWKRVLSQPANAKTKGSTEKDSEGSTQSRREQGLANTLSLAAGIVRG